MNKLIKYFNKNYGKEYGNLEYPRNTIGIYQVYQIIKDLALKDENITKLLEDIKLPKPKNLKEREMYSECINNISNDSNEKCMIKVAPVIQNGSSFSVSINELHEAGNGYYMLPNKEDGTRQASMYFKLFETTTNTQAKIIMASGYGSTPFRLVKDTKIEGKGTIYLDDIYYEYQIGKTKEECMVESYPFYLICNNNKEYTPTKDYHPTTKKYVDDKFDSIEVEELGEDCLIKTAPVKSLANICEVSINELHEAGNGLYLLPNKEDGTRPLGIYFKLFTPETGTLVKSIIASGYGSTIFRLAKDSSTEGKGTIYLDNIYYEYQISEIKEERYIKSYPYYLICNNNKEYTPATDYNPATKKYVDDNISPISSLVYDKYTQISFVKDDEYTDTWDEENYYGENTHWDIDDNFTQLINSGGILHMIIDNMTNGVEGNYVGNTIKTSILVFNEIENPTESFQDFNSGGIYNLGLYYIGNTDKRSVIIDYNNEKIKDGDGQIIEDIPKTFPSIRYMYFEKIPFLNNLTRDLPNLPNLPN